MDKGSLSLNTYECDSWNSVKSLVTEISGDNEFFWRGQGDASWHLCSSLYRFLIHRGVSEDKWIALEQSALRAFESVYSRVRDQTSEGRMLGRSEIMVRMQHYGGPTRLLDWTWSPYIASYFALTDMNPSGGALYGLNITDYQGYIGPLLPLDDYDHGILRSLPKRILGFITDAGVRFPIPLNPSAYTGREYIQQSTFLVDIDLRSRTEDILEELAPKYLHKIILLPQVIADALKDLATMNINGFHLFEGIEGCAKHARDHLLGLEGPGRTISNIEVGP